MNSASTARIAWSWTRPGTGELECFLSVVQARGKDEADLTIMLNQQGGYWMLTLVHPTKGFGQDLAEPGPDLGGRFGQGIGYADTTADAGRQRDQLPLWRQPLRVGQLRNYLAALAMPSCMMVAMLSNIASQASRCAASNTAPARLAMVSISTLRMTLKYACLTS